MPFGEMREFSPLEKVLHLLFFGKFVYNKLNVEYVQYFILGN